MSPTVFRFVGLLAGVDFKWHGYDSHSSLTGNHNSPLEGWANRDGSKAANSSAVAETGSGLDVEMIPESTVARADPSQKRLGAESKLFSYATELDELSTHSDSLKLSTGALTARLSSFLRNRPDKSPQHKPRRSCTQRSFLKPSSTSPSSVHATPDMLRSASGFRNARSVLRYLHISA